MRQKTRIFFYIGCLISIALSGLRAEEPLRLVFLGDSLTSGYTLDADLSYPALIQERIDKAELPIKVLNSGVSADTTAGGLSRLDWLMRERMDVLVVALGANDGLRGFDPAIPRQNLTAIIETVREKQPWCVIMIAGMKLPLNMSEAYIRTFERIFPDLAKEYRLELMPFLLEGVAGKRELNMPDMIHPTADGHRIIAYNMWRFLEPTLRQVVADRALFTPEYEENETEEQIAEPDLNPE